LQVELRLSSRQRDAASRYAPPMDGETFNMQGRRWLVFGGSGAVGRFLLRRMHARGIRACVVSRSAPPRWAGLFDSLHWQLASLESLPAPHVSQPLHVLSAGPLDAFAGWLQRNRLPPASRIVALSSMSIDWKAQSPHPPERALAQRLADAEQALRDAAIDNCRALLLRPTLIYGAGIDRSLTPLLQAARRWGWLPWPRMARGLRQPVHADDVAAAMLAAIDAPPQATVLPLPGGDTLPYDAIVDRLLRLAAPARRLALPLPISERRLRRAAARSDRTGALAAVLWRAGQDQIASDAAWASLAVRPRRFEPDRHDFLPW
jgi:nucleoside-diphosphate-sugar epimerase